MKAAAGVLVVLCALSAITLSVVQARRPLDQAVSHSFSREIVRQVHHGDAAVPLRCRKTSVDVYFCWVRVRPGDQLYSEVRRYVVWLRDDLCWRAFTGPGFLDSSAYTGIHACLGG